MAGFSYSPKQIKQLLEDIHSGLVDDRDLPEDLYYAIADYLKAALYKGFGGTLAEFEGTEQENLLTELRDNIYMFSAAKTYQQVKEMQDALFDEDGRLRSFDEFKEEATAVFEKYNVDPDDNGYLATEHNTALSMAGNAQLWDRIESQKDTLPMLEYSTFGDACEICAPLNGMVAPVDDPVWNTVMPDNHFNCKCTVLQRDDTYQATEDRKEIVDGVHEHMDEEFKMNPGKDGYIFSPEHPYFTVAPKDEAFAKNNFGLSIPDTDDEDE